MQAVVDDAWATIGSCNLHVFSLGGHSEMNASIWDAAVARDLRCRLFRQHLGTDTSSFDDIEAIRLFRQIADGNRDRRQGAAFTLSPQSYGIEGRS